MSSLLKADGRGESLHMHQNIEPSRVQRVPLDMCDSGDVRFHVVVNQAYELFGVVYGCVRA